MAKRPNTIFRGKPRYRPQPTILVLCEDLKSGKNYLQDVNRHFRSNFHVEIAHCGHTDPAGIVKEGLKRARKFDRVICAIDRDSHANFDEAVQLAKQSSKLDLCVSHPCFEYWLLLHFQYTRKPYKAAGDQSAADRLIADLSKFPEMSEYHKGKSTGIFAQLLGERFEAARMRGPQALKDAIESGDMNPSTKLFELIKLMEDMAKPIEL